MSVETDWIKLALTLVEVPERGHKGSCGPEAGCDGICMDAGHISETLYEANRAVTIIEQCEGTLRRIVELAQGWGWDGTQSKMLDDFLEEFVNGKIAEASINRKMRALSKAAQSADRGGTANLLDEVLQQVAENRVRILEDFRRAYLADTPIERIGDAVLVETRTADGISWHFERKTP